MKHWIRKFISCILTIAIFMSAIVFPVGAYDFSMNEVIHQYNPHAFTRKNTPAVKWNGKTELKENSYYYTTSAVTISRDVILPENSTLEIRKTLKITNGAKLTVLGDLLVDYDAKVNPVNGTLTVGKSGYIHDYGALAISKKGRLEVYGHVYVMVPGSLSVKGSVSVSADGRAVYAGSFKKYPGAKVNGNITAAVNVTDQLSEELSEFSENEKICVNFLFYDSETARNTTVDGKNILEISLEIQEKYAIPAVISHVLFDDEGGSYKEYKDLSDKRTDVFLRYLKTNFGGSKGYRRYLSNDYFSNIIPNPAFENKSAENPSDNKYIVSDDYRSMFSLRTEIAYKLNKALYDELAVLGFKDLCIRNPLKNGYGAFSAELTKAQIESLSDDSRFLFQSVNDGKTMTSGADKLYISNGNKKKLGVSDWDKITSLYGDALCVVTANDVVSGGVAATDDVYERISCYTDVKWSKDSGTMYSHSASGYFNTELFYRTQFKGLYSFDGFWEELRNANHSVTKNFVLDNCLTYGLFNDSYVYHSVTVSSAAELEKLIADENVLLIIEEQAEQE